MLRITFAVVLVSAILAIVTSVELYDDKYDDIDPIKILTNDRQRGQYYKCFIGSGPCVTADAKFFKSNLPEAIVTKCVRCTEKQKKIFGAMVEWYVENRPEEWKVLLSKNIEVAKAANSTPA